MINAPAKNGERLEFASRLKQALQAAHINPSITKVCRTFNLFTQGETVTVHAVRKWLVGESIPTQEKVQELAAMTHCDPAWLRFGTEPDAVPKSVQEFSTDEIIHVRTMRALPQHQRAAVYALVTALMRGTK